MHLNSILIISKKMQGYAGIRDITIPEAAVTVLCTPDDGCDGHPKHIE